MRIVSIRRPKMSYQMRSFVVGALATLASTSCATGYGSFGLTGGYSDTRIDDTHYVVEFNGNGFASKERVWSFWFYRCAEFTNGKGFAYFDIEQAKDNKQMFNVGSGVIWNARAVVSMFKDIPNDTPISNLKGTLLFSAQRVIELLSPYVKSNGSGSPPDREVVLRGAVVRLDSRP